MKNNYIKRHFEAIKRKGIKILIMGSLYIIYAKSTFGQDPSFSQFYASPVYLNPAMAGSTHCPRLVTNYRNQWPQLNKGYKTYAVSYDQHVDLLSGGIGITVVSDNAGGILNTTSAGLIYAYHLNISRQFTISAALEGNIVQKKLDWEKLSFGDMIDPRSGVIYQTQEKKPRDSKNFLDFCAGIFAYSNTLYAGLAVSHLSQPDESFIAPGSSKLPVKMTVHAGAIIQLGEKITKFNGDEKETSFSPNILLQRQGKFNQFNIGAYFRKSAFVCGVWFRGNVDEKHQVSSDSFITLIGIQKGIFKFGYSYDLTLNKLSNSTGGAHELSIGLQLPCKANKKKRFKAVHCPVF